MEQKTKINIKNQRVETDYRDLKNSKRKRQTADRVQKISGIKVATVQPSEELSPNTKQEKRK